MAQTTPPAVVPRVEQVEPARPLTEFLVDRLHLDNGGLAAAILSNLIEPVLETLVIVVVAVIVMRQLRRLGRWLARYLAGQVGSASPRGAQRIDTLAGVVSNIFGAFVWGTVVLAVLAIVFGIRLGPVLTGASVVSVAVGFGARDLVKDTISGLFMMIEGQYDVGDTIDAGLATGKVQQLGIRSTRILDDEGILWHVPNGEIRRVGNKSQQWSRVMIDIAVAYDSDIDRALQVMKDVAARMYRDTNYKDVFLSEPEILGVEALGDDRVVLRLVVRTAPAKQPDAVGRDLRRRIKTALDAAGIDPPATLAAVRHVLADRS